MKPEPLKEKRRLKSIKLEFDEYCYSKSSIKSAVEWLLQYRNDNEINVAVVPVKKILEAFEDVVKGD